MPERRPACANSLGPAAGEDEEAASGDAVRQDAGLDSVRIPAPRLDVLAHSLCEGVDRVLRPPTFVRYSGLLRDVEKLLVVDCERDEPALPLFAEEVLVDDICRLRGDAEQLTINRKDGTILQHNNFGQPIMCL